MEQVIRWFKSTGVPFSWTMRDIRLILSHRVPTKDSFHQNGQRSLGWTEVSWIDTGVSRSYKISITMHQSLPSLIYRGVSAHELGHVWMLTSGITYLQAEEVEGFCELVSYLYYRSLQSREASEQARRIRENPDPIYGGGFRRLVETHKGKELPELAEMLVRSVSPQRGRTIALRRRWFG